MTAVATPPLSRNQSDEAEIDDEGWVREPGAVGWVQESDIRPDFSNRWELADTDYECEHGRLAGDVCPSPRVVFTSGEFNGVVVQTWPHPDPCGCWPQEAKPSVPTPDLMTTLKLAQEATVPDETVVTTTPEPAPFGRKADGSPRKRPAPSAEQLAAASAGRARAAQARRNAKELRTDGTSAVAGTSTVPSIAVVQSPVIARLVAELDAEIEQLNSARNRLLGVS
jgi:hypothetical protein